MNDPTTKPSSHTKYLAYVRADLRVIYISNKDLFIQNFKKYLLSILK